MFHSLLSRTIYGGFKILWIIKEQIIDILVKTARQKDTNA